MKKSTEALIDRLKAERGRAEIRLMEVERERDEARRVLAGAMLTITDYRRRLERAERKLALEAERHSPFIWDGKGSMSIVARHMHVHQVTAEGTLCFKNGFDYECTATTPAMKVSK